MKEWGTPNKNIQRYLLCSFEYFGHISDVSLMVRYGVGCQHRQGPSGEVLVNIRMRRHPSDSRLAQRALSSRMQGC